MTQKPDFRRYSVHDLEHLICHMAREIVRREPEMREHFVQIAVESSLAAAHETLAAYHRAAAMCSPELR